MGNPQDEDLRALRSQVAQLTARVYELERRAGVEAGAAAVTAAPPKAVPPPPPPPVQPVMPAEIKATPPPRIAPVPAREAADLEGKIGKVWLNRIGIFAILAGVAYFVKYAFDSGWIGPAGKVAVLIIAGILVVLWSERFRRKSYKAFSYSLKALGIGILYFALYSAFQWYHLVPGSVAFPAMIAVTAFTMVLAITQDGEILAAYALVGGFATPLLVSTGENHEIVLFSYIAMLNLGMLAAAAFKPWRRLMWGSLLGTVILYSGWYDRFYSIDQRGLTVFFTALFAAIFAAIPLVTPLERSRWHSGHSITLMVLPIVNAALLFFALFMMYEQDKATLTWYALVLAAYYLGLSSAFGRRTGADGDVVKVVNLIHIAIAVAFITIAIPLKLDAQWITTGWLVESAALLAIAVGTKTDFLRYFAGATLALGVARLLLVDSSQLQHALVFNSRFATYLVAIAIMAGIVAAGEKFTSEREMPFVKIAGLCLNLLALIALTLEAHDFFSRQMAATYGLRNDSDLRSQIDLAWNFSYSAIWLIYGAGMMAFGFWKRDAFVRWQALVLMALTIVKVFAYDSWNLGKVYRILSFIGLGVLLMVVSYIYHRDWLKLSPRTSEGTAKRTSA
jgi:uncharacterized membrane protein